MSMHPMNTARTPDGGVPGRRTLRQILRYGIIGVAQNALAYGVYLVLTWLGLDPKLVVGVTYPLAMLISFLGNRKYTFAHKGSVSRREAEAKAHTEYDAFNKTQKIVSDFDREVERLLQKDPNP